MNTEKIAHFKKKLEAELKVVEGEMETVGRKNPDVEDDWEAQPKDDTTATEPDEKADKFEAYESDSSVLDTLETRWRAIKQALSKIERGIAYGTCEIGGEKIEEERLEANPAARTCEKHMAQEKNLPQ